MDDEQRIRRLIEHLYGNDAQPLLRNIIPKDGTWETALSYLVVREDRKRVRVWRRDIDDNNNQAIRDALRQFREI